MSFRISKSLGSRLRGNDGVCVSCLFLFARSVPLTFPPSDEPSSGMQSGLTARNAVEGRGRDAEAFSDCAGMHCLKSPRRNEQRREPLKQIHRFSGEEYRQCSLVTFLRQESHSPAGARPGKPSGYTAAGIIELTEWQCPTPTRPAANRVGVVQSASSSTVTNLNSRLHPPGREGRKYPGRVPANHPTERLRK